MDAEDLLLREFLGIRTAEQTAAAARWIRSSQRAGRHLGQLPRRRRRPVHDGRGLRGAAAGRRRPGRRPHARAADWIRAAGGIPATRVFTRIWLALFGEWSWDDLPVMPPELIYLPAWFPLNVYDWACWARQTIVPLTIVCSLRPVRPLPFGLTELPGAGRRRPSGRSGRDPWAAVFNGLDRALHVYERRGRPARPGRGLRPAAMRRCAEWIIARQEQDGCWGGIQPPWVYSLIALHLLGYGLDHPVIKRGLAGPGPVHDLGGLARTARCGGWRPASRRSGTPCWPWSRSADAGLPPDHPALPSAARWLLDEEILGPGDWQVRRPGLAPGRLGVRVRQRRLPGRRRHGRGGARAAPRLRVRRRRMPGSAGQLTRPSGASRLADRHAVAGRRLGRVRRRQHPPSW